MYYVHLLYVHCRSVCSGMLLVCILCAISLATPKSLCAAVSVLKHIYPLSIIPRCSKARHLLFFQILEQVEQSACQVFLRKFEEFRALVGQGGLQTWWDPIGFVWVILVQILSSSWNNFTTERGQEWLPGTRRPCADADLLTVEFAPFWHDILVVLQYSLLTDNQEQKASLIVHVLRSSQIDFSSC